MTRAAEPTPNDHMSADNGSKSEPISVQSPTTAHAFGNDFAWVIVELAPDGILVTNDAGRIMMANGHIGALFGYDHDALVGVQVERLLPPPLRHVHEAHRAAYANAPRLRSMGSGLELSGCRADGSEFPIEVSLSPVATDHGTVTVVIVRDVTEQRTHEQTARNAHSLDGNRRTITDPHNWLRGDELTTREAEVLRHVALGHTNAETARLVGVSMRTVESSRSSIQRKLDLQTRAELVRFALDNGMLHPQT